MTRSSRTSACSTLAALAVALVLPAPARAHCDGLDGPVAKSARGALERGDLAPALAWVRARDEAEVRTALQKARAARKLGGEARQLADTWFLETVVRLHRAGEGAPFTGLAPAGRDAGPAVRAADRAVATGDAAEVEQLLRAALERGLERRLAAVRAQQAPGADVQAGRAWVAAYVDWVHHVEAPPRPSAPRARTPGAPWRRPPALEWSARNTWARAMGSTRATRCRTPFEGGEQLCDVCRLNPAADGLRRCSRMVAESAAMRAVLTRGAPMGASDAPIVILGETGSGKEVLARALHASSPRAAERFVAVNCGALPAELMESELFGHARGAFTGAVSDAPGLFEAADRGTLFLDEISEVPLLLQVKLLRALEQGEVRRVGATQPIHLDVRILAATHRDLRKLVERGAFREDLYYRLKVFSITLPPLRDRTEDVLAIARQLLAAEDRARAGFTPEAERALLAHRWPGNIRELVNAVRHGAALAQGDLVALADLPDELHAPPAAPAGDEAAPVLRSLAEVEREHVLAVVRACRGRQAEAARVLGIGRNTLWRKLEAYRREGSLA